MRLVSVMEWNLKSPPEWEWENAAIYGGGAIEMDRDLVDNGSTTYSSADLGMGSSSKSSISTYVYPSSKEGTKNFEEIDDRCPKFYRGNEEYPGLDRNGNFPIASASSIGSGEPMIGLKLGRHSYFEEMGAASTTKGVSFSVMPASSSPSTKRARVSYQSTQSLRCQVEGCNLDLVSAKDYHRRHRICEAHSKSPKVIVAGLERRFCQQCSRFHDLSEFDEKKRSCRRRLSDHNARRRRPQPEVIQFSSTRLSSSLYDQNPRMNFLLNRVPIPVSNHIWESGCNYRGGRVGGDSLVGPLNGGVFDRKLNFPNNVMPIAIPMPPLALNHGSETSAITASNFHVAPNELHRALSLLSTNSRALNDSEFTSLHHHQQQQQQLTHENTITTTTLPHQLIHSESQQNWALSSDLYNNVGSSSSTQFQEFHLFKSPHIPDCFYSNHIN